MDTITYTKARSTLAETMERVCDDHAPMIITKKDTSVVMISLADYQAMEETAPRADPDRLSGKLAISRCPALQLAASTIGNQTLLK